MEESIIREHFKQLTLKLISGKLSITTMESCTSGQLASLITDTEGASAIFKGAFITYSNEVKILEGVNPEILSEYSVYSKETAIEMARACKKKLSADIGIGVTGSMGNIDPNNRKASVPGQVYYAIAYKNDTYVFFLELPPMVNRLAYKLAVCEEIYQSLISLI